ncbi:MAG: 2-oxoglutarate and iron-dependent oxygenase domain-containing protein [Candidatus Baltobacteraceae bacterium]
MQSAELPVVDISPLLEGGDTLAVGAAIDAACREWGFFTIVGHGIDRGLRDALARESRAFFALSLEEKLAIRMERAGRAWRGYFPLGAERTSGRPDRKEGLYFGSELGPDEPHVRAGIPLFGANLFPRQPHGLRATVLAYLEAMTCLGHALMRGVAVGLGLAPDYFAEREMREPLILFRVFRYPATREGEKEWGVGEHTDYGVLTILSEAGGAGLAVRTPRGWFDVPPLGDAFVCNVGDMLERMTGGRYRSTPHRVRNAGAGERLSFPFFFDPGFDAVVRAVAPFSGEDGTRQRWDGASVHAFVGTYGDYLLAKVARAFPELGMQTGLRGSGHAGPPDEGREALGLPKT